MVVGYHHFRKRPFSISLFLKDSKSWLLFLVCEMAFPTLQKRRSIPKEPCTFVIQSSTEFMHVNGWSQKFPSSTKNDMVMAWVKWGCLKIWNWPSKITHKTSFKTASLFRSFWNPCWIWPWFFSNSSTQNGKSPAPAVGPPVHFSTRFRAAFHPSSRFEESQRCSVIGDGEISSTVAGTCVVMRRKMRKKDGANASVGEIMLWNSGNDGRPFGKLFHGSRHLTIHF